MPRIMDIADDQHAKKADQRSIELHGIMLGENHMERRKKGK
jgi:hypothetical protein